MVAQEVGDMDERITKEFKKMIEKKHKGLILYVFFFFSLFILSIAVSCNMESEVFHLTLHPNNGSPDIVYTGATSDSVVLPTAYKADQEFVGWDECREFGGFHEAGTTFFFPSEDVDLYAVYYVLLDFPDGYMDTVHWSVQETTLPEIKNLDTDTTCKYWFDLNNKKYSPDYPMIITDNLVLHTQLHEWQPFMDGSELSKCTVCGYVAKPHVHTYSSTWSSDDSYHWHEATCEHSVTADRANHTFGSDTVDTAPTCKEDGKGTRTCSVCGMTVYYTIPQKGHTFNEDRVCSMCGLHETNGLYVIYDKGSYSDGWRYIEAAPDILRVVNGVPTVDSTVSGYSSASTDFVFGYYRTSDSESNLYVNGKPEYDSSDCTGTAIGTGKNNTRLLVNAMGEEAYSTKSGSSKTGNYAARLCDLLEYTVDGVTYDDWFLPSKDELNAYYNLHKPTVNLLNYHVYYWSSSENDGITFEPKTAWLQDLYTGYQYNSYDRLNAYKVLPMRAF